MPSSGASIVCLMMVVSMCRVGGSAAVGWKTVNWVLVGFGTRLLS